MSDGDYMSALYLHIPFCKQACHYCDFHFSTVMAKKDAMVDALCWEMELRKGELRGETVESVYFGGGTPSLLTPGQIRRLLRQVYACFAVSARPEITLEANPDDLSANNTAAFSKLGINRLSIGVQSFFGEDLRLMNRAHTAGEAEHAIRYALKHFNNISIDLIYGIPGMDDERWSKNLEKAVSFQVPHISAYALTVEPKTALARFVETGKVAAPDDGVAQGHYKHLCGYMEAHGYDAYELSNFGRPGHHSRNNTAYWSGKKYLGIGPSAHSYNGHERSWNVANNPKYLKAIAEGVLPRETETLSVTDRYNEYVMTGLRTMWGVSMAKVGNDFGQGHLAHLKRQAQRHLQTGALALHDGRLRTTAAGKFLADGIASDLFMVNLET